MPAENDNVLVIIPAYNEADNIADVVKRIEKAGYDYVVINDGSTDNTEQILCDIGANHIRLVQNLGIGGAVQTGYRYAERNNYDVAVQFDGDGQHDEGCIADIVAPILAGEADLVVGSRFIDPDAEGFKSSAMRRAGINILSAMLKASTGKKIYDVTSGFRAAGRRAISLFAHEYPDDYPEPESLAKLSRYNMRISEVPVVMHERQGGTSSIGGLSSVYYMVKVGLAIIVQANVRERALK